MCSFRKKPLFLCGGIVQILIRCLEDLVACLTETRFFQCEGRSKRFMELTTEQNGLVLRLNDCEVESERSVSERDFIVKVIMAAVKRSEKKISSLQDKNRTLLITKELMSMYSGQELMVGRSVRKFVRSVATRFVGVTICISRTIPR